MLPEFRYMLAFAAAAIALGLLAANTAFAQEFNGTANATSNTPNSTANPTINTTNQTNATPGASLTNATGQGNTTNQSIATPQTTGNTTAPDQGSRLQKNQTGSKQLNPPQDPETEPPSPPPVFSFDIQRIIPGDLRFGDSQINLLVVNTGNQNLRNLNAVISGEGVSVYNQEPISMLSPGDSKWLLAWIHTKKTGKIPIEVRMQDKSFRLFLNVLDTEQASQAKKQGEEQLAHRRRVREIQEDLANLSDIYEAYSRDYILKESKGYVLTSFDLSDAKTYLRTAQSALAKDELNDASANLVLLRTELTDLREKLSQAAPMPRTWRDPIKDNVAILSGIVGVALGGLAMYEKLKNKKEEIKKNGGWFGKKEKEEGEH